MTMVFFAVGSGVMSWESRKVSVGENSFNRSGFDHRPIAKSAVCDGLRCIASLLADPSLK